MSEMSNDDTYEIPLQDQRVFGAGIKRRRVKFVPSTSAPMPAAHNAPRCSVSDLYLRLVLPQDQRYEEGDEIRRSLERSREPIAASAAKDNICDTCHLPMSPIPSDDVYNSSRESKFVQRPAHSEARPHEVSIVHQVCVEHSHPPHHLDRKRKGLVYLTSHGFDPDARLGLGTQGQGVRYPIKVKPKHDKLGIGAVVPEEYGPKKVKVHHMDANKVRKMQDKSREQTHRLRDMLYGNVDVDRYLSK